MALASVSDVVIVSLFALMGWLMAPLPIALVAGLVAAVIAFALALDQAKRFVFNHFAIV
jgi:H+-transporting ATPase